MSVQSAMDTFNNREKTLLDYLLPLTILLGEIGGTEQLELNLDDKSFNAVAKYMMGMIQNDKNEFVNYDNLNETNKMFFGQHPTDSSIKMITFNRKLRQ